MEPLDHDSLHGSQTIGPVSQQRTQLRTVEYFRQRTGLSRTTAYDLVVRKKAVGPLVRIGRTVRLTDAGIEKFIVDHSE